jgi:thiol-disulfide isomerase/thioredoxin
VTPTVDHIPSRPVAWLSAAAFVATTTQFAAGQELPKNFVVHQPPTAVAAINFEDGQGRSRSLADFGGKVVVLNIWATWCVPCRREMPTLDRLQAALAGSDVEVVPVSIDRGGIETVSKFYAETGVRNLAMYHDASGQAARALGAVGLPTTLVVDRGGTEIGRIVGPAEWDDTAIVEFLRRIVANPIDAAADAGRDSRAPATQENRAGSGSLARGFQWLKTLFIR